MPPSAKNRRKAQTKRQVAARMREASDDTWRTPRWVRELVHELFGGPPDCDPCAPPDNPLGARVFYTGPRPAPVATLGPLFGQPELPPPGLDGLAQPWPGRVWMNPPFSDVALWLDRLADQLHRRMTTAACVLLPTNRYETPAYQATLGLARFMTFLVEESANGGDTAGRVRFERPDGSVGGQSPYASMLLGYGEIPRGAWLRAFGGHGRTLEVSPLECLA